MDFMLVYLSWDGKENLLELVCPMLTPMIGSSNKMTQDWRV
jgi:hypothetical protein